MSSFTTLSVALVLVEGGEHLVEEEDTLFDGNSRHLAAGNAEQVKRMRRVLEDLGYEIATSGEARGMLKLTGGDRVAF